MCEAASAVAELSSGRVRKPEGMNLRTGKPERDGLFCARIFGPVEDLRCLCGKLNGSAAAGQVCDRCGVLCGEKRLRDERWGHVESPVGLIHPCLVPQIAAALKCSVKDVKAVLCFEAALREDGAVIRGKDVFTGRGPGAIARHLGARAEQYTLTRVPVTPPGWRGTRGDPQDEGYARLLHRCNRLSRLIELNAPQIILDNEELMTQQAFERLHKAVGAELKARRPVVVAAVTPASEALLRAVYDDPDDDAARRVYAEHLAAAGDLRGEFILRQLASAARSRSPRNELDLLRRNLDRWLAPLGDAVEPNVVFRRGFLAACKTTRGANARVGDPAWATVEHLDSDIVELIAHPVMRALRSLSMGWRALHAVCSGPAVLSRVDTLAVRVGRCPPPGAEVVTRGEALPGLRALTLVSTSRRAGEDWSWLDGTQLAQQIERLTLQLPVEQLDALSLQGWVEFLQRHPGLSQITIALGKRLVGFELRREYGLPALKAMFSRGLVERAMLGGTELVEALGRALTAVDPCGLSSARIHSPGAWFGDELVALARTLRGHFGASAVLARVHES